MYRLQGKPHRAVNALSRALLPRAEQHRLAELSFNDAGHGYDVFGMSPAGVSMGVGLFRLLYERYFRTRSIGAEHIPARGACVLAANHSGSIPLDATMLWLDVLRHTSPPRVPRPVVDHFVPMLPFLNVFFARGGCVGGARENAEYLLDAGEMLMIFPEGTIGIGKNYRERYRIKAWRVGHAELAIRHRAPVVPAAIIGAEEQFIQLTRIEHGAWLFGAPFLPVTLSPIPLPVHYAIYYGEPIALHERYPDADDAHAVDKAAREVQSAVEALIARGLAERKGIFR